MYFRNQSTMSTSNISYTRVKPQWEIVIMARQQHAFLRTLEKKGEGEEGRKGEYTRRQRREGKEGKEGRELFVCNVQGSR